jgi:hypothetical protein
MRIELKYRSLRKKMLALASEASNNRSLRILEKYTVNEKYIKDGFRDQEFQEKMRHVKIIELKAELEARPTRSPDSRETTSQSPKTCMHPGAVPRTAVGGGLLVLVPYLRFLLFRGTLAPRGAWGSSDFAEAASSTASPIPPSDSNQAHHQPQHRPVTRNAWSIELQPQVCLTAQRTLLLWC